MRMRKLHPIRYFAPGTTKARTVELGNRQYELIKILRHGPATRMDLLLRGRPRIALNTTALVSQLRQKGIEIEGRWEMGHDGDGARARFMRYTLKGKYVSSSRN